MAKNSILSIAIQIVKAGNGDREAIKGLAQLQKNVSLGVGAFAALAGAAYTVDKALDATVGAFVDYAAQVRDLSRLSGASAEESSRLIQAADDVKISYESLQKALWTASKNGIEVNIDSLGRLADEYNGLANPVEQAEFLAKKFGKGGAEMAKLLELGSSGVEELTNAVSDSLVVTEEGVQQARDYEIAMDAWGDSVTGLKHKVGSELLPLLTNLINLDVATAMEEGAKASGVAGIAVQAMADLYSKAAVEIDIASIKMREYATTTEDAAAIQEDLEAQTAAYNDQIKLLGDYIGGDLGAAQDDYNARIAEYKIQLEQARGEEEKRDIQSKIDAETEAYNKRAASIMFNIQQQAIMAAVEQDPSRQQEAVMILGQMAEQYGLIDEAQKHAMVSTASLTEMWMNGTVSTDQFTALLAANTQGVQANTSALSNEASAIYHVGERARETGGPFGEMAEAQAGLADAINSGAAPAVANLKTQLSGLPASGTSWAWTYSISGSGSFPRIPSRGNDTGPGAGYNNNAGVDSEFDTFMQPFASGGQMNLGHDWAMVGEEGLELVSPSGYVFNHEQSMALLSGASFSGDQFMFGGDMGGSGGVKPKTSTTSSTSTKPKRRRRDTGSAPPVTSFGMGGEDIAGGTTSAAAVETLAASTEAAMQSSAAAQAQQVAEGVQTRNVITQGNAEMTAMLGDIRSELHSLNSTLPRSITAAMQQSNP